MQAMGDADALMNFVVNELQACFMLLCKVFVKSQPLAVCSEAQLQDQVGAILGTASSKKMLATPSFRQSPAQVGSPLH